MEQWKAIDDAPGYFVSNMGNVIGQKGKLLHPTVARNGYRRVTLVSSAKKNRFVHCLVLHAFSGPRPEGMQGRHLNGDPGDNRISNLQWSTPKDNSADRVTHGTLPVGTKHGSCKLTEEQVRIIRKSYAEGTPKNWGMNKLARQFNVHIKTIQEAAKSITWKFLDN